jgi:hypothetical protein
MFCPRSGTEQAQPKTQGLEDRPSLCRRPLPILISRKIDPYTQYVSEQDGGDHFPRGIIRRGLYASYWSSTAMGVPCRSAGQNVAVLLAGFHQKVLWPNSSYSLHIHYWRSLRTVGYNLLAKRTTEVESLTNRLSVSASRLCQLRTL